MHDYNSKVDSSLNREMFTIFWYVIILSIILSLLAVSFTYFFNREMIYSDLLYTLLLPNIFFISLVLFFQKLSTTYNRWTEYYIMILATIIPLTIIMLYPSIGGVLHILSIPILMSAIYFSRSKVCFSCALNLIVAVLLYLLYKPLQLQIDFYELLTSIGIFICCSIISIAIITRGKLLLRQLNESMIQQQNLIVKNIIMDKANKLDPLTDLYNHKTFYGYLDKLVEQSEQYGLSFQLAILDLDNFKKINDKYGHWIGDIVLRKVSEVIKAHISVDDFAARYGGEEFAVLFTEKTIDESFDIVEKIRFEISQLSIPELKDQLITVSIGLCDYQKGYGKEQFFKKADHNLYQAKSSGKNKTVIRGL